MPEETTREHLVRIEREIGDIKLTTGIMAEKVSSLEKTASNGASKEHLDRRVADFATKGDLNLTNLKLDTLQKDMDAIKNIIKWGVIVIVTAVVTAVMKLVLIP